MIERGWIDDRYNGANFPPAMMIPQLPKSVFSSQFDALCEHTIAVTESRWITSLYFARKQAEYFIFYVCFFDQDSLNPLCPRAAKWCIDTPQKFSNL